MRIGDIGGDGCQRLLGEFNRVQIIEAEPGHESMNLTPATFDIFAGIVDGFLDMGRDKIPNIPEAVNALLKTKNTVVKYEGVTRLGFYEYSIKYGDREIEFAIEPDLVPIYNWIVRDMIRRHRITQHPSYTTKELDQMPSPLTKVNDAIKSIAEIMELRKQEILTEIEKKE